MSDFIGIDLSGDEEFLRKLKDLPEEAQDAGVDAASEYIVNVMQNYPSKKSVTRRQAYGTPFFTDKQRRYFFAALHSGEISVPYKRTQALRKGWKQVGKGKDSIIANEEPHAQFVQQHGTQSRMMTIIGWKTIEEILKERKDEITRRFDAAVKGVIRKLKL